MPVTTNSELALEQFETAMLAFDQIKFELAYHNLQLAIEEDPNFFMAHFWQYFMSSKSPDKVADCIMNIDTELSDGETEIMLAFKFLVSGENEKVVAHLTKATELYPKDPHVHKILYILQWRFLNDVEGAVASMKRAIEEIPDYPLVYNQLGYAMMDLEEFDKAEEAFDTYMSLAPDIANPYDSKGDYFMATEQYGAAYESYMKAYEIDSSFTMSAKKAKKARQMEQQLPEP